MQLSQPVKLDRIKQMEEILDVKLLFGVKKKVSLTAQRIS